MVSEWCYVMITVFVLCKLDFLIVATLSKWLFCHGPQKPCRPVNEGRKGIENNHHCFNIKLTFRSSSMNRHHFNLQQTKYLLVRWYFCIKGNSQKICHKCSLQYPIVKFRIEVHHFNSFCWIFVNYLDRFITIYYEFINRAPFLTLDRSQKYWRRPQENEF